MIGHLQKNKVRAAVELFSMIHSVDSWRLLENINRVCEEQSRTMKVCLEVNISGEGSKFGMTPEEVPDIVRRSSELVHIDLMGLMTMPPFTHSGESNRIHFRKCRQLLDHINRNLKVNDFCELSMGTSSDFEIAVEEGATYVRIGEAIMGSRNI